MIRSITVTFLDSVPVYEGRPVLLRAYRDLADAHDFAFSVAEKPSSVGEGYEIYEVALTASSFAKLGVALEDVLDVGEGDILEMLDDERTVFQRAEPSADETRRDQLAERLSYYAARTGLPRVVRNVLADALQEIRKLRNL